MLAVHFWGHVLKKQSHTTPSYATEYKTIFLNAGKVHLTDVGLLLANPLI